jgi:hypothetical protein
VAGWWLSTINSQPSTLFSGDHSAVAPPVPIPNTEVKRCSPDGSTAIGRARVGRRQNKMPDGSIHRAFSFLRPTRSTAHRNAGSRENAARWERATVDGKDQCRAIWGRTRVTKTSRKLRTPVAFSDVGFYTSGGGNRPVIDRRGRHRNGTTRMFLSKLDIRGSLTPFVIHLIDPREYMR